MSIRNIVWRCLCIRVSFSSNLYVLESKVEQIVVVKQLSYWMLSARKHRARLCVNGWIRENYIHHDNVPLELYEFCLELYFLSMDSWSKGKSDSQCKFQDGLATFGFGRDFLNIYGELILCKGDVMEWRFKINGRLPNPMFIGIIESQHASSNFRYYFGHPRLEDKAGFAYYCYHAMLFGRCVNKVQRDQYIYPYISDENKDEIKANHDQIIMTLDMTGNKALLSYKTGTENNEFIDHGVAFKLDVTKKYCLAVAGQTSIQLLLS